MQSTFSKMINSEESKTLKQDEQEFKEKWLKLRKYEYYQRHKDSVDKYGIVESEMTLSDKEVVELKTYLGQKQNKGITQIESDEQEKCQTHGLVKVLKK